MKAFMRRGELLRVTEEALVLVFSYCHQFGDMCHAGFLPLDFLNQAFSADIFISVPAPRPRSDPCT